MKNLKIILIVLLIINLNCRNNKETREFFPKHNKVHFLDSTYSWEIENNSHYKKDKNFLYKTRIELQNIYFLGYTFFKNDSLYFYDEMNSKYSPFFVFNLEEGSSIKKSDELSITFLFETEDGINFFSVKNKDFFLDTVTFIYAISTSNGILAETKLDISKCLMSHSIGETNYFNKNIYRICQELKKHPAVP